MKTAAAKLPPVPALGEVAVNLVDHIDAMVAFWDRDQRCLFANAAYGDWFGKTRDEMLGMRLADLLGADLYAKNRPHIDAAYAGRKQVFEREIPTPDGRSARHSLATYTPYIVDGEVQGMFVHVADVTPLKRLEAELLAAKTRAEHLAMHDTLTGLPNRLALWEALAQALAHAERHERQLAVLSIDVDDFKQINDTYGHSAGDMFLAEIATRLRACTRKDELIGRIGGDEFLLLAPEVTGTDAARDIAARLLRLAGKAIRLNDLWMAPGLSIGIAVYPQHGRTPDGLLAAADKALYVAKRLGKNRCACAE